MAEETAENDNGEVAKDEIGEKHPVKEGKSRSFAPFTDIKKNKHNLRAILQNSNANPIRCKDSQGYGCSFCPRQFLHPVDLKKHFLKEHNNDRQIDIKSPKLFKTLVKLDITLLTCAICHTKFRQIDQLIHHLKDPHNKLVYTDVISMIVPFKFATPELRCTICDTEYFNFKLLQGHMNTHFANFICKICGGSFVTNRLLRGHIRRGHGCETKCARCGKTFSNGDSRREHEKSTHYGQKKRYKCQLCDESFADYMKRNNHVVKEHGAPPVVYKCLACDRTFPNQRYLTRHNQKDHLRQRRYHCSKCEMKFYSLHGLKNHTIKHTREKIYTCDFCKKTYGRKTSLREHIRIHMDDKRFTCKYCSQCFVQKCSWQYHMRTRHDEIVC